MSFLSPKVPTPKPPPPVPQIDQAVQMRNDENRLLAMKRGAGATLLTSSNGLPNLGTTLSASATS